MDTTTLFLSLIFGSIGMGLFVYGKKTERYSHLLAGLGLMVCPYFIPNVIALSAVGVVMTIAPFIAARG